MHVPKPLIQALSITSGCDDSFSGIQIFCDDSVKEDVVKCFKEAFFEKYDEEVEEIKQESGFYDNFDFDDDEIDEEEMEEELEEASWEFKKDPIKEIKTTEYGIFIKPGDLSINDWASGDNCAKQLCEALPESMEAISKRFPNITAQGYIAYETSDIHCIEVVETEFFPNPPKQEHENYAFDFVGEKLNTLLSSQEYCQEVVEACNGDEKKINDVIETVKRHQKWIGEATLNDFLKRIS